MTTTGTCPHCGTPATVGGTFHNVSFGPGIAANIVTTCPGCRRQFDLTGGGQGTFSTVAGRLQRVRVLAHAAKDLIDEAKRNDLILARQILTDAANGQRQRDELVAELRAVGGAVAALAEQVEKLDKPDVPGWISAILALISFVLFMAQPAPLTAADVDRIVDEVQRHPTTSIAREPGRNEPCWCGSGSKYKRCHGDRRTEVHAPGPSN